MCSCNRARQPAPAGQPTPNPAVRPRVRVAAAAAAAPAAAAAAAAAPQEPPPISIPTVDTSVWGAPLWFVLHTASVYSRGRQYIPFWRSLLAALKTGLPCPDCSMHYNAWFASHPLRFSMIGDGIRVPLVRWLLALHNNVNGRLDPPVGPWTVAQVMATYGSDEKAVKAAKVAAAVAALQGLQGVIGAEAYAAALALLNSLA